MPQVEAERDEAVALAAVLRGELEKVWPLFGRIPLHLDTADEEVLAGVVFTLSHQQSTEFDHFMKSVRAALATPNELIEVLLSKVKGYDEAVALVAVLREEILAVIAKHVAIDQEKVKITMERGDAVSTLEIDVELPKAIHRAA